MDSGVILTTAGVVVAALLGLIGTLIGLILRNTKRTAVASALIHEQVANNHVDEHGNPINMRDDLDEKFEGLAELVKSVSKDVGGLKEDVRIIRRDQTADRAAATRAAEAAAHAAEVAREALERTQPKPYTRRKPQ
jgi:uncharacterized membrane-anchored protein YhcB (DUF1043 family)